ncbi:SDR family oxidoreductase [Rhodothermus profundi]|uniref:Short-chain dehydrogenase n=1 Tax=Rhodothermus profundi TaxID=633813 RepID=A0A1M6TV15_9BACT|nr:SDR family oxidoreductase [Rhodothermus profundi]SHK60769.1 Short-chain dehydrogenase [Rhodothermus profundi]
MPVVVVTGASQGIGAAIARAFAEEPQARLVLVARRLQKLEAVAADCRARGAETLVLPCDVTDEAAVAAMARQVLDRWGAPDVLVNNAGQFQPAPLRDTSVDTFRAQLEVNLTSAFLVTQAFLESMIARRRGHIFFMGSVASLRAYPGSVAYCAAKHGLLGLARVVREETRTLGIRVTVLLPGATHTPSWEGVALPEERFMPAEDIAQTVRALHHLSARTVAEEIILRPQEGDI